MVFSIILTTLAIITIFVSGILYSFSDFIMRALRKVPAVSAVEVMKSVNVSVYRSLFMVLFMALVPLSIGVSVWSVIAFGWSDSALVLAGSLLYVVGMFFVTGMGNVPLNEKLKQASNSEESWQKYDRPWVRLNTLRCMCGVAAGVCWLVAAAIL